MSSLRSGFQQLRCARQLLRSQPHKPQWAPLPVSQVSRRSLTTDDFDLNKARAEIEDGEITSLPLDNQPKYDKQAIADTGIRQEPKKPFVGVDLVRAVPASPSYFTRSPSFFDAYVKINDLYQKYQHLPVSPPERLPPQLWKAAKDYKATIGEPVKGAPYGRTLKMVKQLYKIEPQLMPAEVKAALEDFKRGVDPRTKFSKVTTIDRFGRSLGVGRRKTSTARVWLVEGTGEVQVNGKPLHEVFGRVHDRESAIWPLKMTERVDKYNVWALVEGGGTTGQAEALTLAITNALIPHEPALKSTLRQGKSFRPLFRSNRARANFYSSPKLDASRATRERWKGKSTAISRRARALPGSSVKLASAHSLVSVCMCISGCGMLGSRLGPTRPVLPAFPPLYNHPVYF